MEEKKSVVENLKRMLLSEGIQVSNEERWNALGAQAEEHKAELEKELGTVIAWHEALFSWHENVLHPLRVAINTWEIKAAFPNQTLGDLVLAITDHWNYLREKHTAITLEEAAASFVNNYGEGLARFFSRFLIPASIKKELEAIG